MWKIEGLLKAIKLKVEAQEVSEGVKVQSMKSSGSHGRNFPIGNIQSNPSASALLASGVKVKCVYCGEDHFSASCTKVTSPSERKSILLSSGQRFNCL